MSPAQYVPVRHRFPVKREPSYKRAFHPQLVAPSRAEAAAIPPTGVLKASGALPIPYNQGQESSCTANAWCHALKILRAAAKADPFEPSRQYVYNRERILDGDLAADNGANVGDGGTVMSQYGVCSEAAMPYLATDLYSKPTIAQDKDALSHRLSGYHSLSVVTLDAVLAELALGHPVPFGFTVYESFESAEMARTGVMPMPARGEQVLGGHAVVAVDYVITDTSRQPWWSRLFSAVLGWARGHVPTGGRQGYLLVLNSWGDGWGQAGLFQMSFDVFAKLGFDAYSTEAFAG